MSIRKDVKNEILTQMATISVGNGYNRTIKKVYDGWRSIEQIPAAHCPCVLFIGFLVDHEPTTIHRKGLRGNAVVRVIEKSQDASKDIYDSQTDVENCVMNNRNWGQGSVLNSELVRTMTSPFGSEAWADVEFKIFWTEVRA